MERRLSAIFAADMVGYSQLMEADEIGTIERHKAHRWDVIDPAIAEYNGRIVKTTGDGLLADFPSVVEAVKCAVAIQQAMEGYEAEISETRRIRYRIGINLGDIIIDDEMDVFGDGVNIAARLEQISEPGGICISGTTFDHLKSQVEVGYEALGEVRVKNIERPIRAYKVLTASEHVGRVIEVELKSAPRPAKPLVAVAVAALLAAMIGGVWWWMQPVTTEPADPSRAAYSLPDKPSIAILPFENLSNDPDQEYFADGFTEDIITNIAQSRELFVIDRNSTFTYKGQAASIKQVAEELGVRYVLEGSARRVGDSMRITAQLIDASTGAHVWAKRYDRPVANVFDVQDELSREIAGTLLATISKSVLATAAQKRPGDLTAYEYVLRSRKNYDQGGLKANTKARELAEQAIAIDSNYAPAYAMVGNTLNNAYIRQWEGPEALDRAEDAARKAIELDPQLSTGHELLGRVLLRRGRHREAIEAIERAVNLNPNLSLHYASLADALTFSDRANDALEIMKTAIRLDPFFPSLHNMYYGRAHYFSGNYDEAVGQLETCAARSPKRRSCYMYLAPSYAELGMTSEAQRAVSKLLEIDPNFSISSSVKNHLPFAPKAMETYVAGLRKAGVPE